MPTIRSSPDTTADAGPTRRRTGPAFRPKKNEVLVRMYGQGLGDCFLLALPRTHPAEGNDRPVYVLIDCGVMKGTPGGSDRMRTIVRDIREATGGRLDVLVITHEHMDHLSGFLAAKDEWQRFHHIGELWTAWTELDDRAGLPGLLKRYREKQRAALEEAAGRAMRFGLADRHRPVLSLLSFLTDGDDEGLAFGFSKRVGEAFDTAKALVPEANRVCCEPGDVRRLPGTEARAYVLGPPRDERRLRQLDRAAETFEGEPTAEDEAGATTRPRRPQAGFAGLDPALGLRGIAEGRSGFNAFVMPLIGPSLRAMDGDPTGPTTSPASSMAITDEELHAEQNVYDLSFPFEQSLRVPLLDAESAATHEPAVFPTLASYCHEDNHWRRIDFDWLATAEALALQADDLTNNISLVLAIELPPVKDGAERNVLLFVGDAQVGNWLSWDEIGAWRPRDGVELASRKPDIADLLRRTVFYKVGHHGSHNATLKAKGVERMREGGGLTAFVPVSVPVAREVRGWSRMPLDALLDALAERTGGRVVLPNGNLWPPVADDEVAAVRQRLGVTVSPDTLEAKVRAADGTVLEGEVPLWVQVAVGY